MNKKYFLIVILFIVFIYSSYHLILWGIDNNHTKVINDTIKENIKIKNLSNNNELINAPDNKKDDIYKFQDESFLEVDFNDLININDEVVGYIQVNGTIIDYPIVKTIDNSYYLTHSFDKSKSKAGWIFLDYRNNLDTLNYNTIIYGHRRKDNSMFGSLKNVLEENWFSDLNNHLIKISTPKYNYIFLIFSVYHIPKENYYIKTYFKTRDDYNEFINIITKRSIFNFNTYVNVKDKILTLSSCYGDNERVVAHAKLIKEQKREN